MDIQDSKKFMTLSELRDSVNLSQHEVALAVGSTASTVYKWERGQNLVSTQYIKRLAELYKCPIETIVLQSMKAHEQYQLRKNTEIAKAS